MRAGTAKMTGGREVEATEAGEEAGSERISEKTLVPVCVSVFACNLPGGLGCREQLISP